MDLQVLGTKLSKWIPYGTSADRSVCSNLDSDRLPIICSPQTTICWHSSQYPIVASKQAAHTKVCEQKGFTSQCVRCIFLAFNDRMLISLSDTIGIGRELLYFDVHT